MGLSGKLFSLLPPKRPYKVNVFLGNCRRAVSAVSGQVAKSLRPQEKEEPDVRNDEGKISPEESTV